MGSGAVGGGIRSALPLGSEFGKGRLKNHPLIFTPFQDTK